jgi:glutamate synthase (ferredoxin)
MLLQLQQSYCKILKIMNKIGISTLHSYRALIFEIGLNKNFTSKYFIPF